MTDLTRDVMKGTNPTPQKTGTAVAMTDLTRDVMKGLQNRGEAGLSGRNDRFDARCNEKEEAKQ